MDLMEHLRQRQGPGTGTGSGSAAASSDLAALNAILENVNDGKVVIE